MGEVVIHCDSSFQHLAIGVFHDGLCHLAQEQVQAEQEERHRALTQEAMVDAYCIPRCKSTDSFVDWTVHDQARPPPPPVPQHPEVSLVCKLLALNGHLRRLKMRIFGRPACSPKKARSPSKAVFSVCSCGERLQKPTFCCR